MAKTEIFQPIWRINEPQARQRRGGAAQLLSGLIDMIFIEMGIPQNMDKLPRLEAGHMGYHVGQQRIRGDIERHAQKNIGAALIELAGELAISDKKLKQAMAGRQGHIRHIRRIPGRNNEAA